MTNKLLDLKTELEYPRKKMTKPIKAIDEKQFLDLNIRDSYMVLKKYDGMRGLLYKGNMYSRTGKHIPNAEIVIRNSGFEHLMEASINDEHIAKRVWDMEIYSNHIKAEEVAGLMHNTTSSKMDIEAQILSNDVGVVIFDSIHVDAFVKGFTHEPYRARASYIPPELYPEVMHGTNAGILSRIHAHSNIEGAVAWLGWGSWNTSRNYEAYKITKQYDAILTLARVLEGKGKREGTVGLVAMQGTVDGKEVQVMADLGKGWTDDLRLDMFQYPENYIGKKYKVVYKEIRNGVMRQPKVEGEVHDDWG